MSKDIEELKSMQQEFQKCANILGDAIKLTEELQNETDEERIKELNDQVEVKAGLFLMQMIKISQIK